MVWLISEESRLGITLICSGGGGRDRDSRDRNWEESTSPQVLCGYCSPHFPLGHSSPFPFISDLCVTLLPVQERNIVSSHSVHFRGLALRRASVFGANDLKIQFSPILYDSWLPETTEQLVYFMGKYSISQSHSEYSLDTENMERSKEEKLSRQPGP